MKTIYIKPFGKIRDTLKEGPLQTEAKTVRDLQEEICIRFPVLSLQIYRISLNSRLVDSSNCIQNNDQIGILPPFSGG